MPWENYFIPLSTGYISKQGVRWRFFKEDGRKIAPRSIKTTKNRLASLFLDFLMLNIGLEFYEKKISRQVIAFSFV